MTSIKKIFLHCTYRCNSKCVHCAVPKSNDNISFVNYKSIVDEAKKLKISYIIIGGGEPLLHPDLLDMVKYAYKNKIKIKLETNGKLLNYNLLDSLKPYLFQLNISLDGSNLKTHNKIRGIDVFNKTIDMIKYARQKDIDVAVWSVIMKENFNEVKNLIKLVKSLNVKKISFLYATPIRKCFKNKERILIDINKYYSILKYLASIKESNLEIRVAPYIIPYNKIEEFDNLMKDKFIEHCDCLIFEKELIHIDPKGDIYPCVLLLSMKDFCLGNINNKKLFKSILTQKNASWNKIMLILKNQKKVANKKGFNKTGCLGLCVSFKEKIDHRFDLGLPICPCRTVKKEWNFDK